LPNLAIRQRSAHKHDEADGLTKLFKFVAGYRQKAGR
jgi:hypothetical protein